MLDAILKRRPFVSEPRRHLLYHIYPHQENGAWQFNCDQLLKRIDLFDGRRMVAIATGPETDSAADVKAYLAGHDIAFREYRNDHGKQEMISFRDQIEALSKIGRRDAIFRAHAKGVTHSTKATRRHGRPRADFWTTHMPKLVASLYESNLDSWDEVRQGLETHPFVGAYKIYNAFQSLYRWAYAGSFYWFDAQAVYRRNWRKIGGAFYHCEAWPGDVVPAIEGACLFHDHVGNFGKLANEKHWQRIVAPELDALRVRRAGTKGARLSIFMATVRPTLARALASLAPQLNPDDEVLLLPDGPDFFEQTRNIAISSGITNWRLIESGPFKNCGHGQINHALPLAHGDYICYLDDDDIYTPNALADMRAAIVANPGRPLLFRMRSHWGETIWRERKIEFANIGSPCIVVPNDQKRLGRWPDNRGGDYAFLIDTLNKYPRGSEVWCDSIVCDCRPK